MDLVRANKGSEENLEVGCHLVAQELGFGETLDELFAISDFELDDREVVSLVAEREGAFFDVAKFVRSTFFCRRNDFIELPGALCKWMAARWRGLGNAMYGTRDAPQMWAGAGKE